MTRCNLHYGYVGDEPRYCGRAQGHPNECGAGGDTTNYNVEDALARALERCARVVDEKDRQIELLVTACNAALLLKPNAFDLLKAAIAATDPNKGNS